MMNFFGFLAPEGAIDLLPLFHMNGYKRDANGSVEFRSEWIGSNGVATTAP